MLRGPAVEAPLGAEARRCRQRRSCNAAAPAGHRRRIEVDRAGYALQADPSKVLNLGKEANEKKVKSMDLSGFKILAFATHGLVPGDLNGLTQPALALSAPSVAGVDGDGLLTMEEILALKLDADWVVLSACNTGAGDRSRR